MEIFSNHKRLYATAFGFFVALSIVVAILPAINNQKNNAPLPGTELLSGEVLKGKHVFIANGCVACHSQQVRNVDMDKIWGSRPSVAADYAGNERMNWWMNTATLMGTERTGPDLTNIGNRLPSIDWHLLHLYNPRAVVEKSIMPAYPWMFEIKGKVDEKDKVVNVPEEFLLGQKGTVVAKEEALQLVAYLQSLKQTPLPDGKTSPEFLYKKEQPVSKSETGTSNAEAAPELDGALLYEANCQACHQANGQGLKGAFPPLKGSKIVLNDNPEIMVDIIMNGYNAREEYAEMAAIGTINNLKPEEVAAIINHERTSWGNNASKISAEEVAKIIAFVKTKQPNQ
jgi:cytochrome c oxidase cbb3-type subunit II